MKKLLTIDPLIKVRKYDDLLEQPIVVHVGDVNDAAALKFSEEFSKAHNTGQHIIPIVIDSPGGSVYSLLSMISDIESSKLPVSTICIGKAMSAGAVLLTCGNVGHRYIDPYGTVMIHDVWSATGGKNEEIKASAKETDRLQKLLFQKMAKNCGYENKEYFSDIVHKMSHAEWFLTAQEAKKHKIVDHIKIPCFSTKVSVEMSFF